MEQPTHRIRLFELRCKQGHDFEAPVLSDLDYGSFLAYDPRAGVVLLETLTDPVWDEVASLVRHADLAFGERSEVNQRDMIQAAYSATIDPGSEGGYALGGPRCPDCGLAPARYAMSEPARWQDVSSGTHARWDQLSEDARRRMVGIAVTRFLK